jgi:starch phosphorylase
MTVPTLARPIHVVGAEAGSDRVAEIAGALRSPDRSVRSHALTPGRTFGGPEDEERQRLRQELELARTAVAAVLAADGVLLLVDARASLVVPETMRVLLDEQGLGWDEAWARSRSATEARLGSPGDQPGPLWPTTLLQEECPRLLEILYEINRRHLDEVEARWPGDVDRRRNVSLFREGDATRLRIGALAILGASRADLAPPWEGPAEEILADLSEVRVDALRARPTPVSPRRWLQEANPALSGILDLALGEGWIERPDSLEALETAAYEPAFRGAYRKARSSNRRRLAALLRERVGLAIDPEALVDVKLGALRGCERVPLVLLGLVREHLRITAGGWTPPAPRTVVIARDAGLGGPETDGILDVARAVADAINRDAGAQPVLRVAVLPDCDEDTVRTLVVAADVSNQPGTAGSGAAGARALAFALNGAVTLGTRDGTVREIENAAGTENLFLFGLGPFEARAWRDGGVYRPQDVYALDPLLRRVLDELTSPRYEPEPGAHHWLREKLLDEHDPWLVLASFGEYVHRQDEALAEFADPRTFTEKAILTVARCRRFWADPLELDA